MSVSGTGDELGAASEVSCETRTPGSVHGSTQLTVVTDVLLPGLGSLLLPAIVARLVRVAGAPGALALIVTVAEAPRPSVPSLQLTVLVPEHLPWLATAEMNDVAAGSVSVSSAPAVEEGPLLAIERV